MREMWKEETRLVGMMVGGGGRWWPVPTDWSPICRVNNPFFESRILGKVKKHSGRTLKMKLLYGSSICRVIIVAQQIGLGIQ